MPIDIGVEQIKEWKRKAEAYDALVEAVGELGGNGRKRGRLRKTEGKRQVSAKGRKSIVSSMTKNWAEARRLHKAGKIPKANLKALKAYREKHGSE